MTRAARQALDPVVDALKSGPKTRKQLEAAILVGDVGAALKALCAGGGVVKEGSSYRLHPGT